MPTTSLSGESTFDAVKRRLPSPPAAISRSAQCTSFTENVSLFLIRTVQPRDLMDNSVNVELRTENIVLTLQS